MQNIPNEILRAFDTVYGEGHWWQVWAVLLTICLVFCFRYSTRRMAACAFVGIGIAAFAFHFVRTTYDSYKPEQQAISGSVNPHEHFPVRKRWLH